MWALTSEAARYYYHKSVRDLEPASSRETCTGCHADRPAGVRTPRASVEFSLKEKLATPKGSGFERTYATSPLLTTWVRLCGTQLIALTAGEMAGLWE